MKVFLILFLAQLYCFFGGGYLLPYGFLFFGLNILYCVIVYNQSFLSTFFHRKNFFLYLFLTFYFFTSDFDVNSTLFVFSAYTPIFFLQFHKQLLKSNPIGDKTTKFFLFIVLIILIYYAYKSFLLLESNEMALRYLVSTEKDATLGIDGFGIPYASSLLAPYLFYFIKKNKISRTLQIFLFAVCAVLVLLVMRSLFMTALLLMALGFFYVFIIDKTWKQKILISLFFILSIVAALGVITTFVHLVFGESSVIAARFDEILQILSGSGISSTEDMGNRFIRLNRSINMFLEHPLFGVGWITEYNFEELERIGVGNHAQWIDMFAYYGLFAIVPLYYLKSNMTDYVKNNNPALLIFIILGFLNPCIKFTILFVVFYYIPLFNYEFNFYNKSKLQTNEKS